MDNLEVLVIESKKVFRDMCLGKYHTPISIDVKQLNKIIEL